MEIALAVLIALSLVSLGYLRVVRPLMHKMAHRTNRPAIGTRDVVFDGVPLGVLPADPESAQTRAATPDDVRAPVAVRFEPPQDVLPEQVGMLRSGRVGGSDLAAALMALVVGGQVRMERSSDEPESTWRLTAVSDPEAEGLRGWLYGLVSELESPGELADLTRQLRAQGTQARENYAGAPRHRIWYPRMTRRGGHYPLFGVRVRSAEAVALRYQLAGFQQFLETADGDRLRFEEGAGVFSRYLPWAVALGVTPQWRAAFESAMNGLDPAYRDHWQNDLAWIGVLEFAAIAEAAEAVSASLEFMGETAGSSWDWGAGDGGGGDGGGGGGGGGD